MEEKENSHSNVSTKDSVTIRIWRAIRAGGQSVHPKIAAIKQTAKESERGAAVGHASLETEDNYLSHWPGEQLRGIKTPVTGRNQFSPEVDACMEGNGEIRIETGNKPTLLDGEVLLHRMNQGTKEFNVVCTKPLRNPDVTVSLNSLDKSKMDTEIKKIQQENYVLKQKIGSLQQENSESCASSVYRVLEKGGINDLSEVCASIKDKGIFAINPHDIEACVKDAKKRELEKHSYTPIFRDSKQPPVISNATHPPIDGVNAQQAVSGKKEKMGTFKTNQSLTPHRWVKAHVWQSTVTRNGQEEVASAGEALMEDKNVGHASVQTETIYASHWPTKDGSQRGPLPDLKKGVPLDKRTYEKDRQAEKRDPDSTQTFYSLDVDAIENKYQREQSKWALIGDKKAIFNTESCSSLSYNLLKEGGINNLSWHCWWLGVRKHVRPLEPNDIKECIESAKKEELRKYPETEQYKPQNRF